MNITQSDKAAGPNAPTPNAPTRSGASIWSAFEARAKAGGERAACWRRGQNGWVDVTWRQWHNDAIHVALALIDWGVKRGDSVLLQAGTRYEWAVVSLALHALDVEAIFAHPSMTSSQMRNVLDEHKPAVAFVEHPGMLPPLLDDEGAPKAPLHGVVYFDAHGPRDLVLDAFTGWPVDDEVRSLVEMLEIGAGISPVEFEFSNDRVWAFTNGTAGVERCVNLSRASLLSRSLEIKDRLALHEGDVVLIAAPLSHVLTQSAFWGAVLAGSVVAFGTHLSNLMSHLAQTKPTIVVTVPRIMERLATGIQTAVETANPIQRALYGWAMGMGEELSNTRLNGSGVGGLGALKEALAHRLVFRKLHEVLGGRVRLFLTLGGPVVEETARFFHQASVLVLESYGFTEAGGITHLAHPTEPVFGAAGLALPSVDAVIEEDGLLVDSIPVDDSASLSEGQLSRVRRPTDDLLLSTDEVVMVDDIEAQLRVLPMIRDAAVFGEDRPFLTALVTLDRELVIEWMETHGHKLKEGEPLSQNQHVYAFVEEAVQRMNAGLPPVRHVKKFALLDQPLSVFRGELTPMLEVRRCVVRDTHLKLLTSFYEDEHF